MSQGILEYELNKPVPYKLEVDDELLSITKQKLQLARYPEEQIDIGDDDWSQGSKVDRVRRLANYWKAGYDWKAKEASINASFEQYKVKIDTDTHGPQILHFAHHRSTSSTAIPLLFVSGWPGSFLEARKLIKPLTSPPSESVHAFHLVVASIPGFGPGDAPLKSGFGTATTAKAFKRLMVDVLGYNKFVTQGGDFGATITRLLALYYPQNVRACHYNYLPCTVPPFRKAPLAALRYSLRSILYTPRENENIARSRHWKATQSGYSQVQSTKPQSLGFALGDSPTGLLAWFVEKYHDWMDFAHYSMPDNEVLTFVMMHWMQGATPGLRFYQASGLETGKFTKANAWRVYLGTPVGVSQFPREIAVLPVDWVRAIVKVGFWREHDRGGHFPAVECPELLMKDLRDWFGGEVVRAAMAA